MTFKRRYVLPFWVKKNDKCLKADRMYSFDVTRNQKTPKGVRLTALENSPLGFVTWSNFDPPKVKVEIS